MHARIQKVYPEGGQNLITFFFSFYFLVDEGIEDPNVTISWPSSACQRNAILMAFLWRGP